MSIWFTGQSYIPLNAHTRPFRMFFCLHFAGILFIALWCAGQPDDLFPCMFLCVIHLRFVLYFWVWIDDDMVNRVRCIWRLYIFGLLCRRNCFVVCEVRMYYMFRYTDGFAEITAFCNKVTWLHILTSVNLNRVLCLLWCCATDYGLWVVVECLEW